MKKLRRPVRIALLVCNLLLLAAASFAWLLFSASAHNVPQATQVFLTLIVIGLAIVLVVLAGVWNRLKYWVFLCLIEIFLVFWYDFIQPHCEPCLTGSYCPPCISGEQITVKCIGIGILIAFLIWQIIRARKSDQFHN